MHSHHYDLMQAFFQRVKPVNQMPLFSDKYYQDRAAGMSGMAAVENENLRDMQKRSANNSLPGSPTNYGPLLSILWFLWLAGIAIGLLLAVLTLVGKVAEYAISNPIAAVAVIVILLAYPVFLFLCLKLMNSFYLTEIIFNRSGQISVAYMMCYVALLFFVGLFNFDLGTLDLFYISFITSSPLLAVLTLITFLKIKRPEQISGTIFFHGSKATYFLNITKELVTGFTRKFLRANIAAVVFFVFLLAISLGFEYAYRHATGQVIVRLPFSDTARFYSNVMWHITNSKFGWALYLSAVFYLGWLLAFREQHFRRFPRSV